MFNDTLQSWPRGLVGKAPAYGARDCRLEVFWRHCHAHASNLSATCWSNSSPQRPDPLLVSSLAPDPVSAVRPSRLLAGGSASILYALFILHKTRVFRKRFEKNEKPPAGKFFFHVFFLYLKLKTLRARSARSGFRFGFGGRKHSN